MPAVPSVGSCQLISSVTRWRAAASASQSACGAEFVVQYYFCPAKKCSAPSPVYLRVCAESTATVDISRGKEQNKVCAPQVAPEAGLMGAAD